MVSFFVQYSLVHTWVLRVFIYNQFRFTPIQFWDQVESFSSVRNLINLAGVSVP